MRILLIEPDNILANTYAEAFQQSGHEIQIVVDAQTAINAADNQIPDLVILEVQLAQHNGIEFLYEFRSYPEWQTIPVIINSTVPHNEFNTDRLIWKQLGIVAYYYKSRTTLRQLINGIDGLAIASQTTS